MNEIFIPVILGTNRAERLSERIALFVQKEIEKKEGMSTKIIDVRDFELPVDGYGQSIKHNYPELLKDLSDADGYIIVAPEYNHGYPGVLKNMLDTFHPEFYYKACGLCGVSKGPWGGARVVESMIPWVKALGMSPSRTDMYFNFSDKNYQEDGTTNDEEASDRAQQFLSRVEFMARSLKWGRENLSSPENQ